MSGCMLADWITNIIDTIRGMRKSWTVWVNGLCGVLITILPIVQDYLPYLREALTPDTYRNVIMVYAVVNILLRIKTTTALKDKT